MRSKELSSRSICSGVMRSTLPDFQYPNQYPIHPENTRLNCTSLRILSHFADNRQKHLTTVNTGT